MTEVPVKIEFNKEWVVTKLAVSEDRMVIPAPINKEILFKSVLDVSEKKSILIITVKTDIEVVYKILSVDKVLQFLKVRILPLCNAYRLMAYFMSPAIRGGVMIKEATWEKGSVVVVKSGIWFVSAAKQISVPITEVAAIELTKRDVQGKPTEVIKIDYLESAEVVSSLVLCPISTLQVLYNFLKETTKSMDMKGTELDGVDQQVAMLVYSGMDSHAIENMLTIPHKQLDQIYDKILSLGLAEVVIIRREIQLSPKGVRYITDASKSGTN